MNQTNPIRQKNWLSRRELIHVNALARLRLLRELVELGLIAVERRGLADYFASSFIARSRPASVVGYMRPFISSFMIEIDWR